MSNITDTTNSPSLSKFTQAQSQDTVNEGSVNSRNPQSAQSQDTVNEGSENSRNPPSFRFVRIQDTVNARISILVDTTTGFYNATKTINQFYELYPLEDGRKQKDINSWTRYKGAKTLIDRVCVKCNIAEPFYELREGVINEYMGTYMCSELYDSLLMWLDIDYGLDLLRVIKQSRSKKIAALVQERDEAYKRESLAVQDKLQTESTLSKVERMITSLTMEFRAECKEANLRAEYANQRADEAKFNLQQVEKNLTSEIRYVADMLKEKSIHSTMDPKNNKLVHNYVCLGYDFTDENGKKGRSLYHIAGQDVNVRKAMRKKYEDESHQWKEVIAMHYSANPIDLRNNIKSRIGDYKSEVVKKVNDARAREVMIYNNRLKEEIKAFNKLNPTNKRMFSNEKHVVKKISVSDIPIRASKLTSAYIENEFVSYDEYLDVVRGVDIETKKSPYQSEASDSDETKQE
jgi:KilA-N domain/Protein of unknown function (DUF3627)